MLALPATSLRASRSKTDGSLLQTVRRTFLCVPAHTYELGHPTRLFVCAPRYQEEARVERHCSKMPGSSSSSSARNLNCFRDGKEVEIDANIRNFAPVARIMKNALPENAKIAKEAKECMQECVSEFISFITSEGIAPLPQLHFVCWSHC